jgi:hypothetical protein
MPQDGNPVRQGTRHNAMLPLARNLESREGMTARFGVTEALSVTTVVLTAGMLVACGERTPSTDAERLAKGREIVSRMSDKLGSAKAFTVRTTEVREQVHPGGQTQTVKLSRDMVVQRPDRFYFKTSGDSEAEGWYDSVGLTLAMHKDKVFAQAHMPETIDRTLDAIHERYGIALPVGDLLYSSPAKALLADTTTGGWTSRDTLDGTAVDHLAFSDRGVSWELWVPVTGDPLPRRLVATFPNDKRIRKVDVTFSDWNLSPQLSADRFDPKVPPDYEGIAMIQRSAVLANMADSKTDPAAPKK